MLTLKIKSIGGKIPEWKSFTDAGLDLHASVDMVIGPHSMAIVPLGICSEFGSQFVGVIKDRSGIAADGLKVSAGVIDSSYRGEWKVILTNHSEKMFRIKKNDRIAQVLFLPCFHLEVQKVDKLADSSRGERGFGSSSR